jgi:uncharacterized membrane-anchored protein
MKRIRFALASLTLFCAPSATVAQGRVDIVQIYENFLASRVAALECRAIDKATEQKFLSNQMTVTIRATQALKERNSTLSDADINNKLLVGLNGLQMKVKTEIAQNGCASERIQQLLKLYKLHSTMSLGG